MTFRIIGITCSLISLHARTNKKAGKIMISKWIEFITVEYGQARECSHITQQFIFILMINLITVLERAQMTHCWGSHTFCCLIVVSCVDVQKVQTRAIATEWKGALHSRVRWWSQGWHSRTKCSEESQAAAERHVGAAAQEHLTRARNASKRQASTFN
jgi:hypothetical protein